MAKVEAGEEYLEVLRQWLDVEFEDEVEGITIQDEEAAAAGKKSVQA